MHPNGFLLRSALGANRALEDDLSFVVVTYRYSMSSDRALTEQATWRGRIQGRSLATVMFELRRFHRGATNISIIHIEWRHEPEEGAGALERRADPERPSDRPLQLLTM